MKRTALIAALALAACGRSDAPKNADAPEGKPAPAVPAKIADYDASRDAAADIRNAVAQAKISHKRVLIEAGGPWSPRCKLLERHFAENPGAAALRDANFITVKVHVESGGAAPAAFKDYPAPDGYPHLYVLDENNSLIQSQPMAEFEKDGGYDFDKFDRFLADFGPSGR